jgi:cell wall-associated NlpC family hydrolase
VIETLKRIGLFLLELLARAELDRGGRRPGDKTVTTSTELEWTGYDAQIDEFKKRAIICDFVRKQEGEPYHFGAEGPADQDLERWDCAELVEHGYAAAGEHIPDGSLNQRAFCMRVTLPRPGDLACFEPNAAGVGHVEIYVGQGRVIGARSEKVNGVQKGKVRYFDQAEVEAHPRFAGWYRHPNFARPKEDRA